MTVSYSEPWASRGSNRKLLTVGAVAALLLVGGVVAAKVAWPAAAPAADAPAQAPAPTTTTFSLGSFAGAPGVPVQVPVLVAGASGLGAASVRLAYDPAVVAVVDVTGGDVPGSTLTWRHDAAAGEVVMLLTTFAEKGLVGAGTFAVVTMQAVEDAMGTSSPLALSVASATSVERATLPADAKSGAFRNGVTGDVSGDGVVDRADYDLLTRFLVGEDVELLMLNADVDGDGQVTTADALALHQQIGR